MDIYVLEPTAICVGSRHVEKTPVIEINGQISAASNATFFCSDPVTGKDYVYKPVRGERPLWDFPDGSLTGREVAASELDKVLGWDLIPATQWITDGPLGEGMIQDWVVEIDHDRPVNLFPPNGVPTGWIEVLQGQTPLGDHVVLAHADNDVLMKMALFDAIVNNADRKAGHILAPNAQQIFGIDHGICFHEEDKLRTVIWGWSDSTIPAQLLSALRDCYNQLKDEYEPVDKWLSHVESAALRSRIARLIATEKYPSPSRHWPSIPWPVF